jgi:RHS repeat-associated protein
VTKYLWDEQSMYGDVVAELNSSNAVVASYVLGNGQLISQKRGTTTNYYLADAQNSTRLLTNTSAAVTDTYRYSAFGDIETQTGATTNSYLYTGQQFDSSTGLYSLRARYYDAAIGRFLSRDTFPINHQNPVELNRYVYAAGNPVNHKDPSGHVSLLEAAGTIGLSTFSGAGLGGIGGISFSILLAVATALGGCGDTAQRQLIDHPEMIAYMIEEGARVGALAGGFIGLATGLGAVTGIGAGVGGGAATVVTGSIGLYLGAEDQHRNGDTVCNIMLRLASSFAIVAGATAIGTVVRREFWAPQ